MSRVTSAWPVTPTFHGEVSDRDPDHWKVWTLLTLTDKFWPKIRRVFFFFFANSTWQSTSCCNLTLKVDFSFSARRRWGLAGSLRLSQRKINSPAGGSAAACQSGSSLLFFTARFLPRSCERLLAHVHHPGRSSPERSQGERCGKQREGRRTRGVLRGAAFEQDCSSRYGNRIFNATICIRTKITESAHFFLSASNLSSKSLSERLISSFRDLQSAFGFRPRRSLQKLLHFNWETKMSPLRRANSNFTHGCFIPA